MVHAALKVLHGAGVKVVRHLTGSYVTSLEMAGCSITVTAVDADTAGAVGCAGAHGGAALGAVTAIGAWRSLLEARSCGASARRGHQGHAPRDAGLMLRRVVASRRLHCGHGACRRRGVRQAWNSPQGLFNVRAHCFAPGSCRKTHCAPCRALRSDSLRQVRSRSALRAPTPALRSSSPHKSPLPGAAWRGVVVWVLDRTPPALPQSRARAGRDAPVRRRGGEQGHKPVRWTVCALRTASATGPARPARPGPIASARSAPRDLTSSRLSERSDTKFAK